MLQKFLLKIAKTTSTSTILGALLSTAFINTSCATDIGEKEKKPNVYVIIPDHLLGGAGVEYGDKLPDFMTPKPRPNRYVTTNGLPLDVVLSEPGFEHMIKEIPADSSSED